MEHLLYLLNQYRYFILLPLAIIEGPVLTVVTGFLCSTGFFNLLIAFPILITGDVIGDSLYYCLGRSGNANLIKKIGKIVGINETKVSRALGFFNANPRKTISLSKIILGVGVAGLFLAGKAKVPYKKFLLICLLTSIVQCSIYLSFGLLFGKAYKQIDTYLNYFEAIGIVSILAFFVIFIIKSKRETT